MSDSRTISGAALFILSLLFSPFVGFIIALLYPTKPFPSENYQRPMGNIEEMKTCPMCAEEVKTAAKICKHCKHEF